MSSTAPGGQEGDGLSNEPGVTEAADQVKQMDLNSTESQPAGDEDAEDVVNPWSVSSSSAKGVDYDKLIGMFVCIDLLSRLSASRTYWDLHVCDHMIG